MTPRLGNATKPRPCGVIHGYKGICEECREIAKQKKAFIRKAYIHKDLSMWILKRDNFTCQYCNGSADVADHVIPHSKGGLGDPDNLIAACNSCNMKKGSKTVEEFIDAYPELYGHLRDII